MKPIDPRVNPALLPAGSRALVVAEHQEEYHDLPALRTRYGQTITRWELTTEERQAVAAGADVFLTIFNDGPLQPVDMSVGPLNWTVCPFCRADDGDPHADLCIIKGR